MTESTFKTCDLFCIVKKLEYDKKIEDDYLLNYKTLKFTDKNYIKLSNENIHNINDLVKYILLKNNKNIDPLDRSFLWNTVEDFNFILLHPELSSDLRDSLIKVMRVSH